MRALGGVYLTICGVTLIALAVAFVVFAIQGRTDEARASALIATWPIASGRNSNGIR